MDRESPGKMGGGTGSAVAGSGPEGGGAAGFIIEALPQLTLCLEEAAHIILLALGREAWVAATGSDEGSAPVAGTKCEAALELTHIA